MPKTTDSPGGEHRAWAGFFKVARVTAQGSDADATHHALAQTAKVQGHSDDVLFRPLKVDVRTVRGKKGKTAAHIRYLAYPEEKFVRAYAQYVAHKSGDPALLSRLDFERQKPFGKYAYHSEPDFAHFAPVATAFDKLFVQKGLEKQPEKRWYFVMSDPAVRAALKELREIRARLEPMHAEVEASAKAEQEALAIYLRHGLDEETAAIFAGMHGEELAKRAPARQAA